MLGDRVEPFRILASQSPQRGGKFTERWCVCDRIQHRAPFGGVDCAEIEVTVRLIPHERSRHVAVVPWNQKVRGGFGASNQGPPIGALQQHCGSGAFDGRFCSERAAEVARVTRLVASFRSIGPIWAFRVIKRRDFGCTTTWAVCSAPLRPPRARVLADC